MTARQIARNSWLASALAVLTLPPTPASPQVPPETEARLRSIFEARDFDARSFQATWLPDGSGYTTLEAPSSGAPQRQLIRYDAASGTRTVLASLSHLTPRGLRAPERLRLSVLPGRQLGAPANPARRQLDVRTRHLHAKQGGRGRRQHDLPGWAPNPLHP